jgi:acetyl esterase
MTSEPFMLPDVRAFLDALKANPRPKMTRETIAAMRPLAPQGMAMLEPPVGELALVRDLTVSTPDAEIPIRLFDSRATRGPGPLVVFFHGGGYVIGNIDTHVSMCAEIARQLDLPVISVDYRLAPEHPWPAAPDDAEAAARWIAAHGAELGREITGLVLCGDSAGGNLTIVTATALRDRPAAVPVILQFALYPAVDPCGDYPSGAAFAEGYGLDATDRLFYNDAYRPDPTHWRSAPLHADQAGMPPTLLLTAGLDPLRDQGRAYAARTIAAGVPTYYLEIPGTIHGFAGFRRAIPSAHGQLLGALGIARALLSQA